MKKSKVFKSIAPLLVISNTRSTNAGSSAYGQNGQNNARSVGSGIVVPQADHQFVDPAATAATNIFPLPDSITVSVASTNAGAPVVVYLFNQDILNNITTNGGGAGTITYVYQDGFSGNVISWILGLTRAGVGAICYGVAIRMNTTSGGAGNPAGLSQTNPFFQTYNAFGKSIPLSMNITSNQTRRDQDTSIEVLPCAFNITRISQFGFTMPIANTATVTFYFTPNY